MNQKSNLWSRLRDAFSNRAVTENKPRSSAWLAGRTASGVLATPVTALQSSVAWAATRYISQSVAGLPWHAMRELPAGGSAIARGHRVDQMLNGRTSPETSSFQFRETLVHHALRYGNGYAEIVPDQIGRPMEMYPLHPTRVEVCRALEATRDAYGDEIAAGELFYEVSGSAGKVTLSPKRIFHLRGLGDDGPVGVSVLDFAAQSIGWALAAQLFGASFFGNGMNIGGVVTNKVPMSPEGLALQKAEIASAPLWSRPRMAAGITR